MNDDAFKEQFKAFVFEYRANRLDARMKFEEILKRIPSTGNESETQCHDGPFPPSHFRLFGQEYKKFSRLPWLLLEVLWGKEEQGVTTDDCIQHLYGHDESKASALNSVKKRLSKELLEKGCPAEVERKNERLILVIFRR